MGSCVYHVAHRGVLSALKTIGRNAELENFSSAMYEAREIAIERMQHEAAAAKAEGVVGVDIHEGSHGWRTHIIEFLLSALRFCAWKRKSRPNKSPIPSWCFRSTTNSHRWLQTSTLFSRII
jgi:uncharacterized protein YbjQ (UPF0145 family)